MKGEMAHNYPGMYQYLVITGATGVCNYVRADLCEVTHGGPLKLSTSLPGHDEGVAALFAAGHWMEVEVVDEESPSAIMRERRKWERHYYGSKWPVDYTRPLVEGEQGEG